MPNPPTPDLAVRARYFDSSPLEILGQRTSAENISESTSLLTPADETRKDISHLPSPLLQAQFRSSAATTTSYNAYDTPHVIDSYFPSSPQYAYCNDISSMKVSVTPTPVSANRAPITVSTPSSTNYSRPRLPRTPESERSKLEVLERVRASRSEENLPLRQTDSREERLPLPRARTYGRANRDWPNTVPLEPQQQDHPSRLGEPIASKTVRFAQVPPSTTSSSFSPLPTPVRPGISSSPPFSVYRQNQQDLPVSKNSPTSYLQPQNSELARQEPYDRYSYYELASPLPSPDALRHATFPPQSTKPQPPQSPPTSRQANLGKGELLPEDYLMLGIQSHLSSSPSSLSQSATYFEASATVKGGCGLGMLMWGLALRHGWGVKNDAHQGFVWLKRACELAAGDLEGLDENRQNEKSATPFSIKRQEIKTELTLAIYEVGQCFFQGWGVPRDRAMGFKYFLMAAQLGDLDAQQELGYCYSNGKGCKKDRKEAARWYRAAAEQGASTVGLAWIYKDKFK